MKRQQQTEKDIDIVTIQSKTTSSEDDLCTKRKYQGDEKWNKFVHKTDGLFGGFWHTTDNKHYFLADYHYKYFLHYSKGCKKKYLLQEVYSAYHVCDILDFPKCVSTRLMMFYLPRKHCVNYDLEVIYCETASYKLKQKRKSLSFILKRNRDYLSSFVLLLWPNKRSTVWKLIESPTKRKKFCSYIFSPLRYL